MEIANRAWERLDVPSLAKLLSARLTRAPREDALARGGGGVVKTD